MGLLQIGTVQSCRVWVRKRREESAVGAKILENSEEKAEKAQVMKTTAFFLIVYGVAVVTLLTVVNGAPMDGRGPFIAIACSHLCPDVNQPVCAVDAQGLPKTFANRCFVDFAYCREGKYYVIMKEGEC